MHEVLIQEQHLTAIADAIRTKAEDSTSIYTPAEMAPAIRNLYKDIVVTRLDSLVITQYPKTQYIIREPFDTTGLEVKAIYDTGKVLDVSDQVTTSIKNGDILTKEGDFEVVITYTENGITREIFYTIFVTDIEIVSWANGSDEQILAMVQAADEGRIDLHNYWSIGEEREVTLQDVSADGYLAFTGMPATYNKLVIMDYADNYELTNSTENKKTGSFILQYKYGLPLPLKIIAPVGIDPDGTSGDKWSDDGFLYEYYGSFFGSLLDQWLNVGLAEKPWLWAQDPLISAIIKPVQVFGTAYDSPEVKKYPRLWFLPTEKEVFGECIHSSPGENLSKQWAYYKIDEQNRLKYISSVYGIDTTPFVWWTRSPLAFSGNQEGGNGSGWYMVCVDEEGKSTGSRINSSVGAVCPVCII